MGLQKITKIISTHLLTLLTISVIVPVEQNKQISISLAGYTVKGLREIISQLSIVCLPYIKRQRGVLMNISKFTQKSMQAVEQCEKLAYEYGNQEIEQEHLLYSLLTVEDSLILKLIEKMEIQKEHFLNRVETALQKRVMSYVASGLSEVTL